jgi:hypothetical protein
VSCSPSVFPRRARTSGCNERGASGASSRTTRRTVDQRGDYEPRSFVAVNPVFGDRDDAHAELIEQASASE